jgi:glycine/D-amino acid oxidase-like deaminating enzyme
MYGATLALHLARAGRRVVLLEKENGLLRGASFINQARVHQGYHYPRAILTAQRSRVNYAKFIDDYADCVDGAFPAYYAVARTGSKVTAQQFETFCARIGAPLTPAPAAVKRLFNPHLIEDVWRVTEAVFNAERLAERLSRALFSAGVDVSLKTTVRRLESTDGALRVHAERDGQAVDFKASQAYLCVYSRMNRILEASQLPPIALKQEVTEMALVELPEPLRGVGVTVMCGPFFSFLPFPARPGLHTLSHVRYTPHATWNEGSGKAGAPFDGSWPETHFPAMVKDAARYVPLMEQALHKESLWEIKTVLPASETDDSRPILFARDHGVPGLTCILGGKIDNVYDMLREVPLG